MECPETWLVTEAVYSSVGSGPTYDRHETQLSTLKQTGERNSQPLEYYLRIIRRAKHLGKTLRHDSPQAQHLHKLKLQNTNNVSTGISPA